MTSSSKETFTHAEDPKEWDGRGHRKKKRGGKNGKKKGMTLKFFSWDQRTCGTLAAGPNERAGNLTPCKQCRAETPQEKELQTTKLTWLEAAFFKSSTFLCLFMLEIIVTGNEICRERRWSNTSFLFLFFYIFIYFYIFLYNAEKASSISNKETVLKSKMKPKFP